ncbi:MAG TPA: phospholipid carrier-dependent glycosyltransferase [Leucothrix mucor]|nr:phospholipid carrier-dependent glycosyltransferase [Leucothrix mucor]
MSLQHNNNSDTSSIDIKLLLMGLAVITLWRAFVVFGSDISLYIDEAQYWYWSQNLDFGYYSKPPVIALTIAATTALFGDSEAAIRLGSLLFYPLSSFLIYLIATRLYSSRVGLVSAFIFISMPAVSISSIVISTDVPFFFFWSLGIYTVIRALESNDWKWWLLLGVAGGLGMQSKYTMGVFVFSIVLYLLASKQWKTFLNIRLWAAGIIAALIWLPNLIWNAQHKFITFQHTSEISEGTQQLVHWDELLEFFVGQFGVFGVVSFFLLLYISLRVKFPHKILLLSFTWTFLVVIFMQALSGRANANWAAPAYVAASIMVAIWIVQSQKTKWLVALLSINLLFGVLIYYSQAIFKTVGIELTSKNDLHKRLRGWPEIGQQFSAIKQEYPDAIILGEGDRTILAHLLYQSRPVRVATWNPSGKIRHHFDLHNDLEKMKDKQFLFVTENGLSDEMKAHFKTSHSIGILQTKIYADYQLHYQVYYLDGFKGYTIQVSK